MVMLRLRVDGTFGSAGRWLGCQGGDSVWAGGVTNTGGWQRKGKVEIGIIRDGGFRLERRRRKRRRQVSGVMVDSRWR